MEKHGDFDLKNGVISLEPCSKNPRKQWWDLKYDRISYIGSEKESKREDVDVNYRKKHPGRELPEEAPRCARLPGEEP